MTAPMRKEALDELEKVVERNLKAGDWVTNDIPPDRIFVPKEHAEVAARGDEDE